MMQMSSCLIMTVSMRFMSTVGQDRTLLHLHNYTQTLLATHYMSDARKTGVNGFTNVLGILLLKIETIKSTLRERE